MAGARDVCLCTSPEGAKSTQRGCSAPSPGVVVVRCAHSSLVGGEGTSGGREGTDGGRDLLYAQGSYEQTYQMALSMAAEGAAAADAKQPGRQPHEAGAQARKREEGVYGGY